MKITLKKILIISLIICTIFPTLFSNFALAENNTILSQERAGNYVSNFAINFYNNWSSKENKGEIKTQYNNAVNQLPKETDNVYVLNNKTWIDFVFKNALSISNNNNWPSKNYENNNYYEKTKVADLENALLNEKNEEDAEKSEGQTLVELMNSGKILPGDILYSSQGDYLLYIGGTQIIYATDLGKNGALKYDYIQNYLIEVKRKLQEAHKDEENYTPIYGVTEVYRITRNSTK